MEQRGGETNKMSDKYEKVKVQIFASRKKYKVYDTQDEQQIVDLVHKQVLPREKAEYETVKIKVKRKPDGKPKSLIAYMLRKDTYTSDVVKVDVDENYQPKEFVDEYVDTEDDEDEEEDDEDATYESVDFVAATPVPQISTAKKAVEDIHKMAVNAGLKSIILLGADASVANYKKYLKSGLRGFVNVGHGNVDHIVLSDGVLHASWFNGLGGKKLCPAVVYFNSCKVFNNPLQPAIMNAGARTFVGGIVNLSIGPSEKVCTCFWNNVLKQNTLMGKTLKDCEKTNYHTQGAHGISGDLKWFNFIFKIIDKYKVVLYSHTGNLLSYIHCYTGDKNVMSCEFYSDGSTLPQNRYKGCRVGLVYPWSRFNAVLDLLRNEKPVYFGFVLSTKLGYVNTQLEPTGEGSEKT
jgi:hypothetical protein